MQVGEYIAGVQHAGATTRSVLARRAVLLLREVGERIRNHKRLNVTHERLQGGGQAADMRVHAADNELVAARLLEQVLEGLRTNAE